MTENQLFAYAGGMIEAAMAMDFQGTDQQTGQARPVHLDNRVVITFGRQKVTLNGSMVKAISREYEGNVDFREWVEQCK